MPGRARDAFVVKRLHCGVVAGSSAAGGRADLRGDEGDAKRSKEFEVERSRLKKLLVEAELERVSKNWQGLTSSRNFTPASEVGAGAESRQARRGLQHVRRSVRVRRFLSNSKTAGIVILTAGSLGAAIGASGGG